MRWTPDGIEYEADPRQAERLIRELSLEGAKTLGTPGVKPTNEQLANEEPLEARQCTPFRAIAARGNYLSVDIPET